MVNVELLKEWISPRYLQTSTLLQVKEILSKQNNIQLGEFFATKKFKELQKELSKTKLKRKYLPDKRDYFIPKKDKNLKEFNKFVRSKEFQSLVEFLTNKKTKFKASEIQIFKHQNYTLIQDELKNKKQVQVICDFTKNWNVEWGGQKSYLDEGKNPIKIKPLENSVCIIILSDNTKEFIKYINFKAGKNKLINAQINFMIM